MKQYIFLFIIIVLISIGLIYKFNNYLIKKNDYDYFNKFYQKKIISNLIDNNKLLVPKNKKNKILFITYDNRYYEKYIQIHNDNIKKYANKYDYEYKFYSKCNDNVYWCKIFMVLDELKKNKYDYVVWLDSDTVIKNFDIDISNILNNYSSDIFIGSDNNNLYDIANAGVFIIANTKIGMDFLYDCIDKINDKCIKSDGNLEGIWAGTCYEQGIMNLLIADKYFNYTTLLTNDIIFNYNVCSNHVFIMHLYASTSDKRVKCFNSN